MKTIFNEFISRLNPAIERICELGDRLLFWLYWFSVLYFIDLSSNIYYFVSSTHFGFYLFFLFFFKLKLSLLNRELFSLVILAFHAIKFPLSTDLMTSHFWHVAFSFSFSWKYFLYTFRFILSCMGYLEVCYSVSICLEILQRFFCYYFV